MSRNKTGPKEWKNESIVALDWGLGPNFSPGFLVMYFLLLWQTHDKATYKRKHLFGGSMASMAGSTAEASRHGAGAAADPQA